MRERRGGEVLAVTEMHPTQNYALVRRKTGCYQEPITCSTTDKCKIPFCDPVLGCQFADKPCVSEDKCYSSQCSPFDGSCIPSKLPCDPVDKCHVR